MWLLCCVYQAVAMNQNRLIIYRHLGLNRMRWHLFWWWFPVSLDRENAHLSSCNCRIITQPPCPCRKCTNLHGLWHAYACDHKPLQSADCMMHSSLSSLRLPHQCVCETILHHFLNPTEGTLWAGPLGVGVCVERAFFPVHGMLLMRWSNGSPCCAHRDAEDKSDSG